MRYGLKELGKKSRVGIKSWRNIFLDGVWGSGGFRRVGSGVMIRKLLTRASGTLLASRLGRFFLLRGIWGSGGFRRVGSGVRIRKLLTRASGTLLASRLGRDKIWDFGR